MSASYEKKDLSPSDRVIKSVQFAFGLTALVGVVLMALNVIGLLIPSRSADLRDGYPDFSSPALTKVSQFYAELDALQAIEQSDPARYVAGVNRAFSEAMAHVTVEDIRRNGLDHYGMRVSPWENYFLYALSFLKPDTYLDYEFCSYEKAVARGTGRCGQQTTAVVGYLHERGYQTGILTFSDHVAGTVMVAPDQWHIIDPDYGVTTPHSIAELRSDPSLAAPYYGELAKKFGIQQTFGGAIDVKYGGPEVRWARVCPIEQAAYIAKWVFPIALIVPLLFVRYWIRRRP